MFNKSFTKTKENLSCLRNEKKYLSVINKCSKYKSKKLSCIFGFCSFPFGSIIYYQLLIVCLCLFSV